MPAVVRMTIKELEGLIDTIEAEGGDASELREFRGSFAQQTRTYRPRVTAADEMTTEERLNAEAGHLFPEGISPIFDRLLEYDRDHSLEELRRMCAEAGVSTSGHKKLLAAKLIARERRNHGS